MAHSAVGTKRCTTRSLNRFQTNTTSHVLVKTRKLQIDLKLLKSWGKSKEESNAQNIGDKYRRLRKCQDVLATHRDTYTVAQECSSTTEPATVTCPSHNVFLQPPQDPSNPIPQQQTLEHITQDIKIASLNLGGGINHLSGRQKIVHLMKSQRIDILALQETRVNNNSVEQHGDYIFLFFHIRKPWTKSRAEKERQRQSKLSCKTLSEIELYNLDAEKQGVALVYHKRMQKPKLNVKQINGRLMLVYFRHSTNPYKFDSSVCTTLRT